MKCRICGNVFGIAGKGVFATYTQEANKCKTEDDLVAWFREHNKEIESKMNKDAYVSFIDFLKERRLELKKNPPKKEPSRGFERESQLTDMSLYIKEAVDIVDLQSRIKELLPSIKELQDIDKTWIEDEIESHRLALQGKEKEGKKRGKND